ncbi:MAG: hypothetical protein CML17_09035 [Pusillimonas sp.]|jgi:hypothetical protein|nr:hypothetical protein [Pusillimonas sp.]|tara:strand:- start:3345 stop:3986 length:642 start_codon:yes stop_codon:yes gene_type:complete
MQNIDKAMMRLLSMSDWQEFRGFDSKKIKKELQLFDNEWKRYNPRKTPNNRWGLSVTSFDGGLSGIPDLDSLLNYEQETGITLHNHQCTEPTLVWEQCEELKRFLEPWKKWVTRCHFLRLDKGGFFPDHCDINKHDFSYDEVRFVGFVNTNRYGFKWIYDDKIIHADNGTFWYFNANKRHSVFSTWDNMILLVVCMNFDEELFLQMMDSALVR